MNAPVQDSLVGISDVHGPNKALIDNFDHFWETGNGAIIKEGALVNVAKRTGLISGTLNSDGFLFWGSGEEGGFRFLSGHQAIGEVREATVHLIGRLLAKETKAI